MVILLIMIASCEYQEGNKINYLRLEENIVCIQGIVARMVYPKKKVRSREYLPCFRLKVWFV